MSWALLVGLLGGPGCTVLLDTDFERRAAGEGEGEGEHEVFGGEGEGEPSGVVGQGEGEGEGEAPLPVDLDGDGFTAPDDCDDGDKTIHPGALDLCGDGGDFDCSGQHDVPCPSQNLESPFQRGTALAVIGRRLFVGLSGNSEEQDCKLYGFEDGDLVYPASLPMVGSIDHLDGAWLSDRTFNRVWRFDLEVPGIPEEFRLDGGRPLAPTATVVIARPAPPNVLLVVGQQGEAAWSTEDSLLGSRALAGVDNPSFVTTDGATGQALIASTAQQQLHIIGLDEFEEPAVLDSITLPGTPRGLAASPRRAWVPVSGDLVRVNLDSREVVLLGLELGEDVGALVVDAGFAYVVDGQGLAVIDLGGQALVRRVALPEGQVTDLASDNGRVHALIATEPGDGDRAVSQIVTVGPAL